MDSRVAILRTPETPIRRAAEMKTQAAAMAHGAAGELLAALDAIADECGEVAGVDLIPAGQRDAFERLAGEIRSRVATIQALRSRP